MNSNECVFGVVHCERDVFSLDCRQTAALVRKKERKKKQYENFVESENQELETGREKKIKNRCGEKKSSF